MRKMWKKATALSMIAVMLLSQPVYAGYPYVGNKAEYQEAYKLTKEKAAEIAKQLCSIYGEESVQYALIDNGKIVLADTSGSFSRTENKALKNGNIYGIGSISKMYVTAAIMKLCDEGKVKLDEPVTTYVKDFKMADSRYKEITVRMLLNHSSGLMGSTFNGTILFDDYNENTNKELLEELKTQRLKADPGAFSVYCNDGFTLAEIVVERVTGTSFTNYIRTNFLNPLETKTTKTPAENPSYAKMPRTYYGTLEQALPKEILSTIGAGGIYASAGDLCRFATVFMDENKKFLSDSAKQETMGEEYKKGLWPDDKDGGSISYGLGWDNVNVYPLNQYGIKAVAKGGDSNFYHSSLVVLPEENMAVAVLSSGGASTYNQMAASQILLTALQEKGIIKQIKPDVTPKTPIKAGMPSSVMEYAGYYGGSALYKVDIESDGTLTFSYAGLENVIPSTKMYYTIDGDFATEDGSVRFQFVKEENGRLYLQQSSLATLPALGQSTDVQYVAEKLTENKVSDTVWKTWKERDGKKYFLVDEPYNSVYYLLGAVGQISLFDQLQGYVGVDQIQDGNLAQTNLQIPGMGGRDLSDVKVYTKDNAEYLNIAGKNYISEDAIEKLPTKSFTVKLNDENKWYRVNKAAGKTVTIQTPKNGSVALYDKDGAMLNYSTITGKKKMKLPKDAMIVLIGESGSSFKLTYAKTK